MATALAKGLICSGFTAAEQITASDPFPTACEAFERETGARIVPSNQQVVQSADVVILAVKPQQVTAVLQEMTSALGNKPLIVSIAAGISLEQLLKGVGTDQRVVRVMPNTPCLVGQGASAYARGGTATSEDAAVVGRLLTSVGTACEVPESLLDAVTGLSGSGPAYVYAMIEALSDGGVRMGLPRALATQLAAQTLRGAAAMVLETGEHPGVLKDAVTSPGGTTIAGLHALERGGLRATLMNAVEAATGRSKELGSST